MEPYQKYPEENYRKRCPVHNCYVFHPSNSPNYRQNQGSYIVQQKPKLIQIPNNNLKNRQYNIYTQNAQPDPNSLLYQYQSSDGVLRGYNNNYSFYVSGSSKVKSNVTINNQINNYTTQTMGTGQYPYQNMPIKTNNNNSSYLILEKEPIIYNYNTNYNTSNISGFKYNQIQNKNINNQQRVYQAPKIEKRTVKRIVEKEPVNQGNMQYKSGPRDNYRNINTVNQNPMPQKINVNNYNNYNTKKYIANQVSYRRNLSPANQRPNVIALNYSRPIISQRQGQNTNSFYSKKANNSISYGQKPYQYRAYTEQNDYQTYANYPSNNYQKYNYPSNRRKEYASRTEFPEQRGFNYEYENEDYEDEEEDNEDEDDIYEVPVQYNNYNNKKEFYSERPFTRINNIQKGGKRYGAYTQTLAMNNNYYNEYEYDPNNGRYVDNSNNYYSQPKYNKGQYSKNYLQQEKDITPFQKSLRNIRLNNEEIEMENGERNNNRVKIRTSGANNHRLYISNNNRSVPRKNYYRTFTEQNAYRNQDYVLQDLEEEDYEYVDKNRYNNLQKVQMDKNIPDNNNYNYYNEEEIENDEESEDNDGEKMYDNDKLKPANEDNFQIEHQKVNKNEEIKTKGQVVEDDLYNEDEMPHDRDEIPKKKKVKNIETEINEKYYDNQGNYLGEKKIITTKQVPLDRNNEINLPQEEENGEEEQEEVEEYESENANYINENNEYVPYQSNNKKFKKRGENNHYKNKIKERPSKYHSYFGDSSNNVYYESKPDSKEINHERKKININTNNINNQNLQIRNSNLGIQSENLCVPAEENYKDNENKASDNNNDNEDDNDEKEADEQQIEENEAFDDDEEHNNEINYEVDNNKDNNNINQNKQNSEILNENADTRKEDEKIEGEKFNEEQNIFDKENNKEKIEEELINEGYNEEIQGEENNINKNDEIGNNLNQKNEKEIHEEYNGDRDKNENLIENNNDNIMDNHINNEEEQINEENEVEENENQNIENGEGEEEYVGEEEFMEEEEYNGEEMVNNENENNDEYNNEQEFGEEEGLDGEEENGNYEHFEYEKEEIEYKKEADNDIKKEN